MVDIALRDYRPGDADALYALDLVCFDPVFCFSRHAMRRFAQAPQAVTLLAESGTELAGFVIAHREDITGYIVTLDVAPELRRHGIARSLMGAVESRIRSAGATAMALHVFQENLPAIRFYQGLGYTRTSIAPDFYARGLDAHVYIKRW